MNGRLGIVPVATELRLEFNRRAVVLVITQQSKQILAGYATTVDNTV
jgi:hypothetical protein